MAPESVEINKSDFETILTMIRNSSTTLLPDYEAVAKDLGSKDKTAARKKCWSILKKYGLNSITGGTGGKNGTPAGNVASPLIRGSIGKDKKRGLEEDQVGAEQDDAVETPSKKAKVHSQVGSESDDVKKEA